MNLSLLFKKYTVSFMILVLLLSLVSIPSYAKDINQSNGENGKFELIQDDGNEVIVQGSWDEGILIGILNRETNEVMIEETLNDISIKGANSFIKGKKNTYKAKIRNLDPHQGVVDATLVNEKTNEEIRLYSEGEKVEAQIIQAIPLITWGGSALMTWLATYAASITILGVTAYVVNDVISEYRKKNYNYWMAWVRNGDVYISSNALTDSAAFAYLSSSNDPDVNVFAKTKDKAQEAAKKTKGAGYAIWHDGHSNADGYYQHYHPASYNSSTGKFNKFNNHVWY